jgi:hypothetical protein
VFQLAVVVSTPALAMHHVAEPSAVAVQHVQKQPDVFALTLNTAKLDNIGLVLAGWDDVSGCGRG